MSVKRVLATGQRLAIERVPYSPIIADKGFETFSPTALPAEARRSSLSSDNDPGWCAGGRRSRPGSRQDPCDGQLPEFARSASFRRSGWVQFATLLPSKQKRRALIPLRTSAPLPFADGQPRHMPFSLTESGSLQAAAAATGCFYHDLVLLHHLDVDNANASVRKLAYSSSNLLARWTQRQAARNASVAAKTLATCALTQCELCHGAVTAGLAV